MTTTTIPPQILAHVQHAVATILSWNEAIAQARRMEEIAQQPGRHEYDLRYTTVGARRRSCVGDALLTLETCEGLARANGLEPAVLYAGCGGKPALIEEGPHVQGWR